MRKAFRCSQGHQWEVTLGERSEVVLSWIVCPVCGNAAESRCDQEGLSSSGHPDSAPPFPIVPGYEVLELLGRGGMGIVYKARQTSLNRLVALKMIRTGLHAGPSELARFRVEAEAVARLRHAHIVQIYEIGAGEGQPYLSLEYVEGVSLAHYLPGTPHPIRDAARLIETVARTMHYAHQCGVIHRDLKPANILLASGKPESTDQAGKPNLRLTGCIPKVTDFGLAKIWDDEGAGSEGVPTHLGTILGTPSYMAPEQAEGRGSQVGPATDVYALGAVLYELLTGRPPFRGRTPLETLEQVRSQEALAPSRLRCGIPRDLETIVLHCLRKQPEQRYQSAEALAEDLRRFLAGKPIDARPVGAWERLGKWARRRPGSAALLAVSQLALLLLLAGAWWHSSRIEAVNANLRAAAERERRLAGDAQQRRREAEEEEERGRWQLYASRVQAAGRARAQHKFWLARQLLEGLEPPPGRPDYRGLEWDYLWQHCTTLEQGLAAHPQRIQTVAFSADGRHLATASFDRVVKVWDRDTGRLKATLSGSQDPVWRVVFSPDGCCLAAACGSPLQEVRIWDLATGRQRHHFPCPGGFVRCLRFSPDSRLLALSGELPGPPGSVLLWDLARGESLRPLRTDTDAVWCLAFSPDGRILATASRYRNEVLLWDVARRRLEGPLKGHTAWPTCLAFTADGSRLAAGSGAEVCLWDVARERLLARVPLGAADCNFTHVGFDSEGRSLVAVTWTGDREDAPPREARVLDGQTGALRRVVSLPPGATCEEVALAPDARSLAVSYHEGLLRLLNLQPGPPPFDPPHGGRVWSVAFAPDGRTLASGGGDQVICLWDVRSGRRRAECRGHLQAVNGLAFRPDGRVLASAGDDWTVRLWDPGTGRQQALLFAGWQARVQTVAFTADGKRLAAGTSEGKILLWDLSAWHAGELPPPALRTFAAHSNWVRAVVFTPDGGTLISAGDDGKIRFWDAVEGRLQREITEVNDSAYSLALSPDGKTLLAGNRSGLVRLWDVETGTVRLNFLGHTHAVRGVAFAPSGWTIASAGTDRTVRIWDVTTGLELAVFGEQPAAVSSVAFTLDGKALAAGSYDGRVSVWQGQPTERR